MKKRKGVEKYSRPCGRQTRAERQTSEDAVWGSVKIELIADEIEALGALLTLHDDPLGMIRSLSGIGYILDDMAKDLRKQLERLNEAHNELLKAA